MTRAGRRLNIKSRLILRLLLVWRILRVTPAANPYYGFKIKINKKVNMMAFTNEYIHESDIKKYSLVGRVIDPRGTTPQHQISLDFTSAADVADFAGYACG